MLNTVSKCIFDVCIRQEGKPLVREVHVNKSLNDDQINKLILISKKNGGMGDEAGVILNDAKIKNTLKLYIKRFAAKEDVSVSNEDNLQSLVSEGTKKALTFFKEEEIHNNPVAALNSYLYKIAKSVIKDHKKKLEKDSLNNLHAEFEGDTFHLDNNNKHDFSPEFVNELEDELLFIKSVINDFLKFVENNQKHSHIKKLTEKERSLCNEFANEIVFNITLEQCEWKEHIMGKLKIDIKTYRRMRDRWSSFLDKNEHEIKSNIEKYVGGNNV